MFSFLVHAVKSEKDEEAKLKLSTYLIQLQNIRGLRYYVKYIENNRVTVDDSSPSNPLYKLTKLTAIWLIFRLYEMSFDKGIKQESFSNLKDIAIVALQGISLSNKNFPKAQIFFVIYKIKFGLWRIFDRHSLPDEVLLNFNFFFENMVLQYYVRKGMNIDLVEAKLAYQKLN